MSEFPKFEYSNKQVLRAGEALAGNLIWTEETKAGILETFTIANNWRDSHALPMRRLRFELLGLMRRCGLEGITAARLKRMRSIRKKLHKLPVKLNQIQDLAGCRAIVPAIADVNSLVDALRGQNAHTLHSENDYLKNPKPDGYRSHHMVFKFQGEGDEAVFTGRRVEVQIRTRLQHSWATAVEAVGLFRREDLKSGQGNADWLRLFQLMSMEFALAEGCLQEDAPARRKRVVEIIELDRKLVATSTLETLSQAVRYTESYVNDPAYKPEYYLIKYNHADSTVSVEPHSGALGGVRSYDRAESSDNASGNNSTNTVLVEVDKIENLKEAYPNYFGDVQLFKKNLKDITQGKEAQEYTLPPQKVVPKGPKEKIDLTWFKKKKRWS
jgi:hypothetical protein